MELHPSARLGAQGTARPELERYLARLPLGAEERRALASRTALESPHEAMAALHAALGGEPAREDD
nr:hypothetical protein [Betaproteobacteria bacterium]